MTLARIVETKRKEGQAVPPNDSVCTARLNTLREIPTNTFQVIMSSDLFAEFSSFSEPPAHPVSSQTEASAPQPAANRFSFFDDLTTLDSETSWSQNRKEPPPSDLNPLSFYRPSNLGQVPAPISEETDEWGDFEGAAPPQAIPSSIAVASSWEALQSLEPTATLNPPQYNLDQNPSIARHNFTDDPFDFEPLPVKQASPSAHRPVASTPLKRDPNVLFDVSQPDDEDDFGDFEAPALEETVRTRNSEQTDRAAYSLFHPLSSFSSRSNVLNVGGIEEMSHSQKLPSVPGGHMTKLAASHSIPPSHPQAQMEDVPWDDFTDWETSLPISEANETGLGIPGISPLIEDPVAISSPGLAEVAPDELPPTNVPPPGILLALFLSLFSEAQTKLFNPMAAQTYQMKNKLLSDPAILSFLRGYLMIATVAARIIAGRKLRWKRDMHLAQGMKLGPASSRGTSGMKLTGIDKSEINKEEREALDVVRAWREQLGRLRSAVAAANVIRPAYLGTIPDVQEVMSVRVCKEIDGGIPAPQQCALCGLKRDERVNKVDVSVEDSFGEWWIEQVSMHRGKIFPLLTAT